MNQTKQAAFLLLMLSFLFTQCKKKGFEEYYERPGNLEPPVYQVLAGKGNFTSLLALIDKAGYAKTLGSAGYWTLFAPNDAAFQEYFTATGLSADKIDSATAQAIVQHLLVYNAFNKDRIDDYQSNAGWVPDAAFRRRTAYYSGFYTDTTAEGQQVKAIASNRNGSTLPYVAADNNNKYIFYFTDAYFGARQLTAADYNYFYPGTPFTGFNVGAASVVTRNIAAENGVVHELSKVVLPRPSIEEYLKVRPEYSAFRRLYQRYMSNFILNDDASRRYQLLTGDNRPVYVKVYNNALAFSPNNENFLKVQDNDSQQDAWSIFVPRNEELEAYIRNVLLEYYGKDLANLERLPPQVIADFLNAHMWQTAVWPTKFGSTFNFLGEEARFHPQNDVADRQVLSNGLFYGTTKVQDANVFSSVYSRAYLDPKYTMMTRLLDAELKFLINSPQQRFTLFMMSDEAIRAAGYDYVPSINEWGYTVNGVRTAGEAVRQRLLRILNTSLVLTPNGELANLGAPGTISAYNGEVINFSNNQVVSGGSLDAGRTIVADSARTVRNGKVYYLNSLLTFSETQIGLHISRLGTAATSDFNSFWQFLRNSASYNAATGEISGIAAGSFYTVLIPSNAAIRQAVIDGVLPGDRATGAARFAPTLAAEREQVNRFILYHILNKRTVIPDGKDSGGFETLLKNAAGDALTVTVISAPGSMQVTDMNNRRANVIIGQSNNLSNRTVIHLLDNYLKYNY